MTHCFFLLYNSFLDFQTITVEACSGGLAVTSLGMACLVGVAYLCPKSLHIGHWENQSDSIEMNGFSVLFIGKIVDFSFFWSQQLTCMISLVSKSQETIHLWCPKRGGKESTFIEILKQTLVFNCWQSGVGKVIDTKYSKHWPYTVAHTINCVCIKC